MFITEDDDIIRTTLQNAGVEPETLGLEVMNQKRVDEKNGTFAPIYPQYIPTQKGLKLQLPLLNTPLTPF